MKENIRKTMTIPTKRKMFIWKIIESIEYVCRFTYKITMPFIPALVVNMLDGKNGFLVFILTLAGMFRVIYNLFERRSLKEIYLKLKWEIERK